MRGIRRLVLLVVATTVAFGFAVVRFESAAEDGCAQRAGTDPAYRVQVRPVAGGAAAGGRDGPGPTTYRLRVLRHGRPVPDARVCIAASVRGMPAMAAVDHGRRTAPGTYEVTLDLAVDGRWEARVVVDEPGRRPAAVSFDL